MPGICFSSFLDGFEVWLPKLVAQKDRVFFEVMILVRAIGAATRSVVLTVWGTKGAQPGFQGLVDGRWTHFAVHACFFSYEMLKK